MSRFTSESPVPITECAASVVMKMFIFVSWGPISVLNPSETCSLPPPPIDLFIMCLFWAHVVHLLQGGPSVSSDTGHLQEGSSGPGPWGLTEESVFRSDNLRDNCCSGRQRTFKGGAGFHERVPWAACMHSLPSGLGRSPLDSSQVPWKHPSACHALRIVSADQSCASKKPNFPVTSN